MKTHDTACGILSVGVRTLPVSSNKFAFCFKTIQNYNIIGKTQNLEVLFTYLISFIDYLCSRFSNSRHIIMKYSFRRYSFHYKTLFALGLPIVVGQVGTIVLGFADTLMVGHHSVTELAAASFVNTIMAIILVLALGFSYGMTPLIGVQYGRGDADGIGVTLKNGILAASSAAAVLVAVLIAVYRNVAGMGQPAELLTLMRPYMVVNIISVPFVCWFNTMKQFFDAIGHTKTSMYIMVGANILNIIGNYLLIYGPGGMPEMGLLGAGISTLASRVLMCAAAMCIFFFSGRYRGFSVSFHSARLSLRDYRRINKQSVPVSLQMGMESAAFALTGIMVGWLGTKALATHQIMITFSQVFFMVYYGIAAAVSVRVSYFMGQREYGQLRDVAAAGFHIIMFIGTVVSIPVFLFRHDIGFLFADDAQVAAMCSQILILMIIYQFGDGMQCNYANALRGTSYVKPMMFIAFVSYIMVSLPLSWLLGIRLGYGIVGIWTAFPVCLTVAGSLYYYFFRKKVRSL